MSVNTNAEVISVETSCPICGHEYTAVFADHELAQLRADLQAAQARVARIDTDNRTLISEYKTLEDRYTEQARQLDAAREIIGMAKNDYQSDVQDGVDSYDKGQRCIDWLAANPAPEAEQQP